MPNYNPNPTPIIRVVDLKLPYETHDSYEVTFDSHTIQTRLTSKPYQVDSWLSETLRLHHPHPFIVGLDIELSPSTQRVATLQLCINRRCLVFHITHAPFLPDSLSSFLSDANHTFVGVGIQGNVEKLLEDYSLRVARFVDLRSLAAAVLGDPEMMRAVFRTLAQRVLGKDVEKPRRIARSKWDNARLTAKQVMYATVDAFLSFEIGRRLYSNGF